MKIDKKIIKGSALILVFVFTLAAVLELLSLTYFSKGSATTYNNQYANAYSYMDEPENSIQIAGIGNSDLYSAIVPAVLWEEVGYTSTLIASPKQTVKQSYKMLSELLKRQSPDLVIIETDMLYNEKPARKTDIVGADEERFLDPVFDTFNPDEFEDVMKGVFPVFIFHDKWKQALKKEKGEIKDIHSHGYHFSLKCKKIILGNYMEKSENLDRINTKHMSVLEGMITLCKNRGCDVLLTEVPAPDSWSYERHNAVEKVAEQYGVKFLDFNVALDEIGIDPSSDFRDLGNHLNYYGAQKVTKYLASYLKNEFNLEDRRNDSDYGYWNDSVTNFYRDVEKEKKRKINNI